MMIKCTLKKLVQWAVKFRHKHKKKLSKNIRKEHRGEGGHVRCEMENIKQHCMVTFIIGQNQMNSIKSK